MKILVTGATGMVGAEVLRQAMEDKDISEVIALARRPLEITHPKITTVIHHDYLNYDTVQEYFKSCDACIWCLGTSQLQVSREQLAVITCDYTVAAIESFLTVNPSVHFVFLSGNGADRTEKSRVPFARLKGRAENALLKSGLKYTSIARPKAIWPKHKNKNAPFVYKLFLPLFPLISIFAPGSIIGSVQLAKSLIYIAKNHGEKNTYENIELKSLGENS